MNKRIYFLLIAVLTMGNECTEVDVTDPKVADTMTELNRYWHEGYSKALDEIGTRHYQMDRNRAFDGMIKVMESLGFQITMSEGNYYISVSIPAERMFSNQEWSQVRANDEPQMRKIASRILGVKGNFARLEPEGLLIDGKITLLEIDGGTEISMTFRLNAIKPQPPESILPRREYPPPYAARVGYEKIWRRFEKLTVPIASLSQSN